jgi:iron complex transport system ATP-binding protein
MDLTVKNISFAFRNRDVLCDISFAAKAGTVTAIIGSNAAGKSTLLKCIMGIFHPKGTVLLDGRAVREFSHQEMARFVGYLPQGKASETLLTVLEVVLLGRMRIRALKIPPEELQAVWKIMEKMQIDDIATQPFSQLSGGQHKVVSIAQILVREPQILLLDEPTASLDIQNQLEITELIRNYTRQWQTATVLTLHDLNIAARFADQVIVLKGGHVHCVGTPQEVFTPQIMEEAYGVRSELVHDSDGTPIILPVSSTGKFSIREV